LRLPLSAGGRLVPATGEALVARLARAALAVWQHGDFLGMPGASPKPVADVPALFVPLRFAEEGREEPFPQVEIEAALAKAGAAARFVVRGDPGAGKSMLCRALAVGIAQSRPERVPVLVALRDWVRVGPSLGFLDFAARDLARLLSVPLERSTLEELLAGGKAVLLVDGLDEVVDPSDRERVRDEVAGLAASIPAAPVLVTSRFAGYDVAPLDRRQFRHLGVASFDDAQLDEFVDRWYAVAEPRDVAARDRGRADLKVALGPESPARDLARTPLLATLVALVHRSEARLPGERAKLYELAVRLLVDTWPARRRQRFPDLDEPRQREVLESLALAMIEGRRGLERQEGTIGRSELVRVLEEILAERSVERPRRVAERWVEWLQARSGLLVEQQPGVLGFFTVPFWSTWPGVASTPGRAPAGSPRSRKRSPACWRGTLVPGSCSCWGAKRRTDRSSTPCSSV
jgi:hypothetical protein